MAIIETPDGTIFTDVYTFYEIAKEAYEFIEKDIKERITPNKYGSGNIIKIDHEQKSFKKSFICIVFVGIWLEALLHQKITKSFGKAGAKRNDRNIYEEKLKIIGITDPDIIERVKRFRISRNDIVHEKVFLDHDYLMVAQDEAKKAFLLMEDLKRILKSES